MQPLPQRYIAIEGPIGVGKTSLARRFLEHFDCELLLERAQDNPFLKRFYQNPREAALSTQLYFLLQRARQIQDLRQADLFKPLRVADFIMDKDPLFAQLTLDATEFDIYSQVYAQLTIEAPVPDLVLYLQAPVEILKERIERRGVDYERLIEVSYLDRLAGAYAEFFHHYDRSALLIVNAAEIDPVGNDADFDALLERIRATSKGRHYFNPLPFHL
jgi:deoxyguanosine kinase